MTNEMITIGGLKKEKKFSIPFLQRDYVWEKREWERLLRDIFEVYDALNKGNEAQLFLGNISLHKHEDKYEVIDGQQRLTTLTILMDVLTDLSNYNKKTTLRKSSYFNIDGIKAEIKTDIIDNDKDNDKDVYCMVYNFFAEMIAEYSDIVGDIISIIEKRVFVYLEHIDGDEKSNDAFERLNATGEPLVYTDLILNQLINLAEKDGKQDIGKVRKGWNEILESISSNALPPQTDSDTVDDERSEADNDDEVSDDDAQTDEQPEEFKSAALKTLKIKKFFNALHSVTLPKRESFPESVDDFMRMMERLRNSFYPDKELTAGRILAMLKEWAGYYIEYTAPSGKESYVQHLFYLRTIGNTSLIPAVMRTLYRYHKTEELSESDIANIFHALVTAQLLRAVYTERDNTTNMDNKLRIADYIYIAMPKKDRLGHYLADSDEYGFQLVKDYGYIEKSEFDSVKLWNMPYSSGYSKAILSIRHDMLTEMMGGKKIYEYEKEDSKFQVEHLVPLKLDGDYSTYGYNYDNINSFWNLELLESGLNIDASNKDPEAKLEFWGKSALKDYFPDKLEKPEKMKENRVDRLRILFNGFKAYCAADISKEINISSLNVVSYHKNGLLFDKVMEYSDPGSDILSVSIENGKYIEEPEQKNGNNSAEEYIIHYNGEKHSFVPEKGDGGIAKKNVIFKFLECAGATNNSNEFTVKADVFDIINSLCMESDNGKEIKTNNLIFMNVDAYERAKDSYKKVNKDNTITINEKRFYYNTNNSETDFVDAFALLYKKLCTLHGFQKFGLFTKKKQPAMRYIKGRRILTKYNNACDREIYEDFVLKEYQKQLNGNGSNSGKSENQNTGSQLRSLQDADPFISADSWTFAHLIGNSFHIPEYQRAYVWGDKQINALVYSLKNNMPLGTIILYEQNGTYSIVDGQQRLTTLGDLYKRAGGTFSREGHTMSFGEIKSEDKSNELKILKRACFNVLIINKAAPETFQYKVFATINGCGKRLTLEDKVKNYLCKKVGEDNVRENIGVILRPGFIKAYTEMCRKEHIAERELYNSFKDVYEKADNGRFEELKRLAECYGFIKVKGYTDKWDNLKDPELKLWLKMYQLLNVNTADALLLYLFGNDDVMLWYEHKDDKDISEETADTLLWYVVTNYMNDDQTKSDPTEFMRKLIMMYFLLRVDDPNGNSKKSINSKLPRLIGETDSFADNMWDKEKLQLIIDDVYPTIKEREKREERIFQYLCSYDLAQNTPKHIARFILLLCELWCGLDIRTAIEELDSSKPSEIEHIFPANPPKDIDVTRPEYISKLMNVCLLEAGINKTVGNNMLEKKLESYKKSKFILPKMFYSSIEPEAVDKDLVNAGCFGKDQAKLRIELIWKKFKNNTTAISFGNMLDEVTPI